jgi:hypothetical protein
MFSAFAIMLPAILLACGLCIDLAMLELCQVRMQAAADGACLTAEYALERNTGGHTSLAQQEASTYGFINGSNNTTVSVLVGPDYGAYAGRQDAIEVTITQQVKTIFMGALNGGYVTVQAQATALVTPCIYLLGTGSQSPATFWSISGATNSSYICPMSVNYKMEVDSPSHANLEAINLRGPNASLVASGGVSPTPNYASTLLTDPLASAVASPTFSGCNYTSYSVLNTTAVLNPGTYCKGLNITNSIVTLNPGLYIVTGGATWAGSTVTGDGVTLFFTKGGGGGFGQFLMNYSTLYLTAPTSSLNGSIPTITVFADRSWTPTAAQDFRLYFSTMQGDGIWYMPGAGIYIWNAGTVTGSDYFGIVADNLYLEGTDLNPRGDYSSVSTGNPFRRQSAIVQ